MHRLCACRDGLERGPYGTLLPLTVMHSLTQWLHWNRYGESKLVVKLCYSPFVRSWSVHWMEDRVQWRRRHDALLCANFYVHIPSTPSVCMLQFDDALLCRRRKSVLYVVGRSCDEDHGSMVGCAVPEFCSECPSLCLSVCLLVGGWQNPEHQVQRMVLLMRGRSRSSGDGTLHSVDREIEITFSHDDTEEHQKQWL